MQPPDKSLRYHVEVRYRKNGALEPWKVYRTSDDFQDALGDWGVLWHRNFSRLNIRIRDTHKPKKQQIIYP